MYCTVTLNIFIFQKQNKKSGSFVLFSIHEHIIHTHIYAHNHVTVYTKILCTYLTAKSKIGPLVGTDADADADEIEVGSEEDTDESALYFN